MVETSGRLQQFVRRLDQSHVRAHGNPRQSVTFFDYRDFSRRPAWFAPSRGPDVSRDLRRYLVVTALQLALDMAVATTTPMGHGHVFAPRDYIDAWIAVADVRGWSPEAIAALKRYLSQSADEAMENDSSEEGAYSNRGG